MYFNIILLFFALTLCSQDQYAFDLSHHDDEEFMSTYHCNKSHSYQVRVINREPLMMEMLNFLAPGEAEHMIYLGKTRMERSGVVKADLNEPDLNVRSSFNSFLKRSEDDVVRCIEERISYFSQKPVENLEPLQVVWYRDGQQYHGHYDFFAPGAPGSERELARGGQRIMTFFIYLNDVPSDNGGATSFPEVEIKVQPVKSKCAFWYNVDVNNKEDMKTLHSGDPVFNYEKFGINGWVREFNFQ